MSRRYFAVSLLQHMAFNISTAVLSKTSIERRVFQSPLSETRRTAPHISGQGIINIKYFCCYMQGPQVKLRRHLVLSSKLAKAYLRDYV